MRIQQPLLLLSGAAAAMAAALPLTGNAEAHEIRDFTAASHVHRNVDIDASLPGHKDKRDDPGESKAEGYGDTGYRGGGPGSKRDDPAISKRYKAHVDGDHGNSGAAEPVGKRKNAARDDPASSKYNDLNGGIGINGQNPSHHARDNNNAADSYSEAGGTYNIPCKGHPCARANKAARSPEDAGAGGDPSTQKNQNNADPLGTRVITGVNQPHGARAAKSDEGGTLNGPIPAGPKSFEGDAYTSGNVTGAHQGHPGHSRRQPEDEGAIDHSVQKNQGPGTVDTVFESGVHHPHSKRLPTDDAGDELPTIQDTVPNSYGDTSAPLPGQPGSHGRRDPDGSEAKYSPNQPDNGGIYSGGTGNRQHGRRDDNNSIQGTADPSGSKAKCTGENAQDCAGGASAGSSTTHPGLQPHGRGDESQNNEGKPYRGARGGGGPQYPGHQRRDDRGVGGSTKPNLSPHGPRDNTNPSQGTTDPSGSKSRCTGSDAQNCEGGRTAQPPNHEGRIHSRDARAPEAADELSARQHPRDFSSSSSSDNIRRGDESAEQAKGKGVVGYEGPIGKKPARRDDSSTDPNSSKAQSWGPKLDHPKPVARDNPSTNPSADPNGSKKIGVYIGGGQEHPPAAHGRRDENGAQGGGASKSNMSGEGVGTFTSPGGHGRRAPAGVKGGSDNLGVHPKKPAVVAI